MPDTFISNVNNSSTSLQSIQPITYRRVEARAAGGDLTCRSHVTLMPLVNKSQAESKRRLSHKGKPRLGTVAIGCKRSYRAVGLRSWWFRPGPGPQFCASVWTSGYHPRGSGVDFELDLGIGGGLHEVQDVVVIAGQRPSRCFTCVPISRVLLGGARHLKLAETEPILTRPAKSGRLACMAAQT